MTIYIPNTQVRHEKPPVRPASAKYILLDKGPSEFVILELGSVKLFHSPDFEFRWNNWFVY